MPGLPAARLRCARRRKAASVTAEYVWLDGLPLAFVAGGAVHFVHTDHLGTPQVLTDGAAAVVVWNADYAPFGVAVITGGVTFNLRFPGQYFDAETGAHHNGFRTYDPKTGRYLQSDPIGLQGGWNTYGYVGGNPVMRVDPEGLLSEESSVVLLSGAYYGLCVLLCLGENGNPLGQLADEVASGGSEALAAGLFGNAAGNIMAGDTGRMGVGGTPRHSTTWQHKVGGRFGPGGSRVGKVVGRAAVGVTLAEGALNLVVAVGCLNKCVNDLVCILNGGRGSAPPGFDGVSP